MISKCSGLFAVCATFSLAVLPSASVQALDLKDAAPADVFLAVHARHNAERDYQKQYYEEVWATVQKTRLLDRVLQIAQSRMNDGDAEQFVAIRDSLKDAVSPIEWDKVLNASETLYAQRFAMPSAQHILMMRIPDGGADGLREAVGNLFRLADEAAGDNISVVTEDIGGFDSMVLQLPDGVPFHPLAGVKDDVFLFASSREIAREAVKLLNDPSAESKFDDPRVAEALSHLPEAEDVISFFDGQALATQMKGIVSFVEQQAGGNPEAERVVQLLNQVFDQFDAFDYEISVEYTDGYQNRSAGFGKYADGARNTVLGKMTQSQKPFENWGKWVPADATAFSLNSGINIRPLYTWAMEVIPASFPEAQQGLDQFAAIQDQFDVHLDEDVLQSFTGEVASMTFAGGQQTPFGQSGQSVVYMRCENPERIQELLHRAMNTLGQIPQVASQGVGLKEIPGMDGFEELTANAMAMSGMRPVIGFKDGWMIFGTHAEAVQKVDLTKSGEAPSIEGSELFTQFNLPVEGAVNSISYENSAKSTRDAAMALQQVGMMAPMFLGMAAQNGGDRESMEVVQEVLGLLPAVGQIIGKFDFIESKLSVTQAGPTDNTYIRHGVVLIRPPEGESRN
jgi:hypothetical protein